MANIFRGKVTRNKTYLVSGYAVTPKGHTRSAEATVEALNRDEAIIGNSSIALGRVNAF
jgi:hypothetical protein